MGSSDTYLRTGLSISTYSADSLEEFHERNHHPAALGRRCHVVDADRPLRIGVPVTGPVLEAPRDSHFTVQRYGPRNRNGTMKAIVRARPACVSVPLTNAV
jgi:hypothetical protein